MDQIEDPRDLERKIAQASRIASRVTDRTQGTSKRVNARVAQEEDAMSAPKKPLKPDDFPVNADGKKIKKQDGTQIADTDDPAVASDVAERLNDDEARREDDKWSA